MNHIGIIGGGFSGIVTAVNLSRLSTGPLRISIVNAGYPLGRGVAYSTRNSNHLLNVAARNMSALADQPAHFLEWLLTRSEYYEESVARLREKFVPRRVYGDYLHGLFYSQTCSAAEKGVSIETISAEATDIVPKSGGASVALSNGQSFEATRVVLATGNPAPPNLKLQGLDPAHPKCFQNPWSDWQSKLKDLTENVILVGTGLTAIDATISLQDLGWKGKIFAISRNGLLPLSHFKGMEYPEWLDGKADKITLREALRAFERNYRNAEAQGVNPAILVDKLRPITQQIWQNFSLADKKRFNRHFRTRWNVVRHRIAQSIHQQLLESMSFHRLEIVKGRLTEASEYGDQIVVTVKTGGSFRRIEGGALINCTGPSESCSRSQSPLYANLLSRGLVQPDEMDMGIKVSPEYAAMDKSGKSSGFLYALGPVLKGSLWESSAVPELRSQAFRLAEILAKQLYGKSSVGLAEAAEVVHEYEI